MSKSESPIRTFLAVALPSELRQRLGALEPRFAGQARTLKWVDPDLLHITVRFLGNVPAARIEAVKTAAREAVTHVTPFSLQVTGLGAFPNERAPRVLWAGLAHDQGYQQLERLFGAVEQALGRQGFEPERRGFSPHVTLARTRDEISSAERRALGETLQRLQEAVRVSGSFAVDELIVMRSDLSPRGPRYTPMLAVTLGSAG